MDIIYARIAHTLKISIEELFNRIPKDTIDLILSQVLKNRSIDMKLLTDPHNYIVNPYDLTNLEESAKKISDFISNEDNILYVYSDYDGDGVMAGTIIHKGLANVAKCKVIVYFPERSDGYGLSLKFCEGVLKDSCKGNKMVITVDNGITKIKEVDFLLKNNIEVIITDHHESLKEVPNCLIVDPHNKTLEQDERTKGLCGAGVAFKLIQAIQALNNAYNTDELLPYVAIATITDVMPYTNENVAFIQYALEIMNSDKCPSSIQALKDVLGISIMSVKDIAWSFGPVINACGRLGNTALAARLFLSDRNLTKIAKEMDSVNRTRKSLTEKALKRIDFIELSKNNVAIVKLDSDIPGGIGGIIAGKIVSALNVPAIVVQDKGDGLVGGSTRSVEGLDILNIFQHLLEDGVISSCGGHAVSCGVSFPEDNIDIITDFFNKNIERVEITETEEVVEDCIVDVVAPLSFLDEVIFAVLQIVPSDGKHLDYAKFKFSNLDVVNVKVSGKNDNNGFVTFKQNGKIHRTFLCGNFKELMSLLENNKNVKIDIVAEICAAFWQKGLYSMNIVEMKKAED